MSSLSGWLLTTFAGRWLFLPTRNSPAPALLTAWDTGVDLHCSSANSESCSDFFAFWKVVLTAQTVLSMKPFACVRRGDVVIWINPHLAANFANRWLAK